MARPKHAHPHVSWRDGRPRFSPGPKLRKAGHRGFDLRWPAPGQEGHNSFAIVDLTAPSDNAGRWFSRGECVDWSEAFIARLGAAATPKTGKRGRPAGSGMAYTVMQLLEDWQHPRKNPRFDTAKPRALKPKTITFYRQCVATIEQTQPDVYATFVAALDRPICRAMFDAIWSERGLATARGCALTLSAAIGWGQLTGRVRRADNPCSQLQMPTPDPRVRFASRREIKALIAAAEAEGQPAIGDAILLGVWSGQRQADRLAAVHKGLWNKRRVFRQAKTGAVVAILEAPELEIRFKAAEARRRAAGIVNAHVLLNEATWHPFTYKQYRARFLQVRARAIKDGCKSLADFRDQDLRDTAVTWLALAGATIPEIINITGHTAESATRILKHYLAQHPALADSGIRKMIDWYDNDGETEIGL